MMIKKLFVVLVIALFVSTGFIACGGANEKSSEQADEMSVSERVKSLADDGVDWNDTIEAFKSLEELTKEVSVIIDEKRNQE